MIIDVQVCSTGSMRNAYVSNPAPRLIQHMHGGVKTTGNLLALSNIS